MAAAAAASPIPAVPRPTCKAVRRGYGAYPNLARIHPRGCKLRSTVSYAAPYNMMGGGGGYHITKRNKRGQVKYKLKNTMNRELVDVTLPAPAGSAGGGVTHGFIWDSGSGGFAGLLCGLVFARTWGLFTPGGNLNDYTTIYNGTPSTVPNLNRPIRIFNNSKVDVSHVNLPGRVFSIVTDITVGANMQPRLGASGIANLRKQGLRVVFK